MKIKLLFLTAFLGLGQLINAQTKAFDTPTYEPVGSKVQVKFQKGYTTSEQKTPEGNLMIIAYEQGLNYNFSVTTVYPVLKSDKMDVAIDDRFIKLIADQANYFQTKTGKPLMPEKQSLPGQTGFATSFDIDDYTYAYRVVVLDNVYYLLSASSLTTEKNNKAIAQFFNSFGAKPEPVVVDDNAWEEPKK